MQHFLSALAVCLLTASVAEAQPAAAGGLLDRVRGNGVLIQFLLMEQPSVQQELQATAEQVQAVRALGERQRAQLEGISQLPQSEVVAKLQQVQSTADTEMKRILSPEQHRRLSQIALQQAGPLIGLSHPEVAKAVGLTADQQAQLRVFREDLMTQVASNLQGGGVGPRRGGLLAGIAEVQTAKRDADARALKLLTPEQQVAWREQQGEPFRGEINLGPAGGNLRPGANFQPGSRLRRR
uniref:Periplasmic heavy metal sensor n=1 Tax=Schlesneria paludicola TaxID=360056 RepID=A0A7C2NW95_9PLAN